MKTKKSLKKLSLKRQTISHLNRLQMQGVNGGGVVIDLILSIDIICEPIDFTKPNIPPLNTTTEFSIGDFTCKC